MLKHVKNIGGFFNFILVFVLLNGCISEETKIIKRNANFREILSAYDTVKTEQGIVQNFEHFKNTDDELILIFNDINADFRRHWDNAQLKEKIISALKTAQERNAPELMQFQLYFLLANIELYHQKPKKAYELNLQSLQILNQNPEIFSKEIKKIQEWNKVILKTYYKSTNYIYNNFKEELNDNKFDASKRYYLHYNLAVYELLLGQYEKSNTTIKEFFNIYKRPGNNKLYSDAMAVAAVNYAFQEKYDSLKIIDNQALDYFNNNEFSKDEYFNYLSTTLKVIFHALSQEQVEERIKTLKAYYEYNCQNSYSHSIILEGESKYYKYINDIDKEIRALKEEAKIIEDCVELDDYRIREKKRIYKRLTKIAIKQQDYLTFQKLFNVLKKMDSTEKKLKSDYVEFAQYLSYKDLQSSQNNYEKYQEEVIRENKIYRLYILLVGIFIALGIFLVILYRKNLQNQIKLNQKTKQLQHQNKTVKIRNGSLRNIISSLEESNSDLKNFARVAAHDIKSPIATIKSGIDFLQHYYKTEINEEHFIYFEILKNSTEDLIVMINELLNEKN